MIMVMDVLFDGKTIRFLLYMIWEGDAPFSTWKEKRFMWNEVPDELKKQRNRENPLFLWGKGCFSKERKNEGK
jgi:hypothetical protein